MRIRALSVFEGVIYHCVCLDPSHPCRPTVEVEAVVRDGDVDEGPLLLSWADYVYMVGVDQARRCRPTLADAGRLVDFLGVTHISFPMWTPRDVLRR